jgi:hypothetical protein
MLRLTAVSFLPVLEMSAAEALNYADLIVAIFVIFGVAKSAYNGYVQSTLVGISALPEIAKRLEAIENAVFALSLSVKYEEYEPKPEKIQETLGLEENHRELVNTKETPEEPIADGDGSGPIAKKDDG